MMTCVGIHSTLSPLNTSRNRSRSNNSGCKRPNMSRGNNAMKRSSEFAVRTPLAAKAAATRASAPGLSAGSARARSNRAKPSRSASCIPLHCPKSMSPMRPSGNSKMFPGCGSPLKKGQKNNWKPCTLSTVRNVSRSSSDRSETVASAVEDQRTLSSVYFLATHISASAPTQRAALVAKRKARDRCGASSASASAPVAKCAIFSKFCRCLDASHSSKDLPLKSTPRASKRCRQTASSLGPGKYSMPMTEPFVSSGMGSGTTTRPTNSGAERIAMWSSRKWTASCA
mmetsp:Transcript_93568/g.261786  ORF Transcript_93568/g.261786 Transcript_93568/m.261786 type:complete len:285 (-) Transcript_93568:170-1024(-)